MDRVQRVQSAIGRYSSTHRSEAMRLLTQLRACLDKKPVPSGLAKVSLDIIELMGHDVTSDRRVLADFNPKELLAVNLYFSVIYWREEGSLFGGPVVSWRTLNAQGSMD
jgi:hypothetical protein